MTRCASCGLPAHRYGRNEGVERYDPTACINMLRSENEQLRNKLRLVNTYTNRLIKADDTHYRALLPDWLVADISEALAGDSGGYKRARGVVDLGGVPAERVLRPEATS